MKFNTLYIQKRGFSRLFIIALTSLLFACSASVKSDLDESAKIASTKKNSSPPIPQAKVLYPVSEIRMSAPIVMAPPPPAYSNQSPLAHHAPIPMSVPLEIRADQAPTSAAKYQEYQENGWKRVSTDPVSTFSADVDTGSYANVRRFLSSGQFPQHDAVRAEEMINYFAYDYSAPKAKDEHPVSIHFAGDHIADHLC